jgi:O-antigen ligase
VKNFAVNMFFEQGWLGCIAMGLLLLTLAADLARRALRGETMGAVYLAALSGMMVVGLFDSLVDVPRLTLLLLLVASCAALRPAPPKKRRRRSVPDQAAADLIA